MDEWTPNNPNSGHGHVHKRPDGVVMRCGGPAICKTCKKELEEATDFGPGIAEFPEEEWLLHHFTVYSEDQIAENGERYLFDGPNGRYMSGNPLIRHRRFLAAADIWHHLEERGGWGPNESLEVHHRFQGGDWERLTTREICSLAEEYQPLTYWWEKK